MAERRMFSRSVVESARFLKMPVSSQNLYFHLVMNADDDGIVEAYSVINLIRANEDDLRVLHARGFVRILNEDLVTYVMDWREQNKIRPDRKKDSIHKELLQQTLPEVKLLEKKERSDLVKKSGPSVDGTMSAQCSRGKESAGKESRGEVSRVPVTPEAQTPIFRLGNEFLTEDEYRELVHTFSKPVVDGVIGRILRKPYHGCLNYKTIYAWCTEHRYKTNIINTHIRPYFEQKSLSGITAIDILQWQNELLSSRDEDGKGYAPTFLRTIQNQLNAIFNHAVKYYDLPKSPCDATKKMGTSKNAEMLFWTKQEYQKFSNEMKEKPISYYAFQVLYWTGIRVGELLALTKEDFDLENRKLRINKNYQVIKGVEKILTPKSMKSIRVIDIPQSLCDEMQEYFDSLYKVDDKSRIFVITKSYLHHEMNRGSKAAGVKRIRIHDLRHSNCALLIDLGYSPVQIAERLGHESSTITERYAHLYPSVQQEMAEKLDQAFKETGEEIDED